MDKVAELKSKEIYEILFPSIGFFLPLLEEKRAEITSTPKKTFKYGEAERHKLDIYYPSEAPSTGKTPIIFFIYGGGFAAGDRSQPPPADLGYGNLANYFSRKGFITIIPDYRLMPDVSFPGPMEDVKSAVKWILENDHALRNGNINDPDTDGIFLMGHSAGGVNVATILLYPGLVEREILSKIKGAVIISAVYNFDPQTAPTTAPDVLDKFWGGYEEFQKKSPYALLKNASEEAVGKLPKILMVESENDPDSFITVGTQWQELLDEKTKEKHEKVIAKGHNHISITWALSTGQGEEWAEKVTEWLKGI
ncbi:alpha/beta-hydrolase [Dendrothele bispora CBS 962.96]|uniref:Alpha/beta-hydrolase n=1 Tax=Dendrothele bispora (strain CBS 962.96) TaxID=1314807 RepID=A0A4S8MH67_DENBC|nr:alpha/beta-hydrolase [Dendrothele bispora CBS 962.96]